MKNLIDLKQRKLVWIYAWYCIIKMSSTLTSWVLVTGVLSFPAASLIIQVLPFKV